MESDLFFKLTRERNLFHPTSRKFDAAGWSAAVSALEKPSKRDLELTYAAIFYGTEITRLRQTYEPQLFCGMARRSALLLSVAIANYNYVIVRDKANKQAKESARRAGGVHLSVISRQRVASIYPGNEASPDSIVATIVDTLPHCLERLRALDERAKDSGKYWNIGARLFSILSVEHSLRDLWQQVLWEGWAVSKETVGFRHVPTDQPLATLWNVWIWRQQMISGQGAMLDSINEQALASSGQFIEPFLKRTVVGIGGKSADTRAFRYGSLSGRDPGQAWHATEDTALRECYLAPFLETPLPRLPEKLSCLDLQRIWCVLRDCATVLLRKRGEKITDLASVERHALLISRRQLEKAIASCAALSLEQVIAALDFLTCDPTDLSSLFVRGLWAKPIISAEKGENVCLVFPAIAIGSPIRRVEAWLDRGGLSDALAGVRRGLKYEEWVRRTLAVSISANVNLPNARCAIKSIDSGETVGEQIDLIIRLGHLLIVGEVKCLLAPIESIENYNYLRKLRDAGEQASRKAAWIAQHPGRTAEALDISEDVVKGLLPLPIVVVNQSSGFGLKVSGARVVDFHFLNLYLADNHYVAGAAFRQSDRSAMLRNEQLYSDEKEAASEFDKIMSNPPPLKRFLEAIEWTDNQFPLSDGSNLNVANCHLKQQVDEIDANMMQYLARK